MFIILISRRESTALLKCSQIRPDGEGGWYDKFHKFIRAQNCTIFVFNGPFWSWVCSFKKAILSGSLNPEILHELVSTYSLPFILVCAWNLVFNVACQMTEKPPDAPWMRHSPDSIYLPTLFRVQGA